MPAAKRPSAKKTVAKPKARRPVASPAVNPRTQPRLRDVLNSKEMSMAAQAAQASIVGGDKLGLTPTDKDGVFRNRAGILVDESGILLAFGAMKNAEAELDEQILGGPVDTPAKLLKRVALDPRQPMFLRLDAAKAAAPYFDRKTPVAIETKNEDTSIDIAAVAALPRKEREALLITLSKLGVNLGGPKT